LNFYHTCTPYTGTKLIFFTEFEVLMVVNVGFKAMQFGESPMFGGTYIFRAK
jgi:hypothetical protein